MTDLKQLLATMLQLLALVHPIEALMVAGSACVRMPSRHTRHGFAQLQQDADQTARFELEEPDAKK